jgi:hypothetical protein
MAVKVFKSTDASAPVLTGLAGSLVGVLDACLVNGYGAISSVGWAIAFTGANKRIYRAPSGQLRGFYRVQDDAPNPTFAGGREARVKGSEQATAIDTQTNLFPTAVQLANGLFVRKSATADATAVPWIVVADARTCYFFCNTLDYTGYAAFAMGEYYSLKPTADVYNGIVVGRAVEQVAATPAPQASDERLDDLGAFNVALLGHFVPRSWTEFYPSAVNVGKHGNAAHSVTTLTGLMQYPNPVDGALWLHPVHITEPAGGIGVIRGRMRGFWHFLHPVAASVNDGQTWAGTGSLAGKTFMAIKPTADALGMYVMETSDTWETN